MTNLIGISGKKGSGKDTVAQTIQYFRSIYYKEGKSFSQFVKDSRSMWVRPYSEFENKKFADKLKDMVCLLIGCTREQLEDPEFKESLLGEKWWVIDKPDENLFLPYTPDNWAAHGDFESNLVKTTPRNLLQELGTDVCRQIHPSAWINALFVDYTSKKHDKWVISDVRFPDEAQAIKNRGGIVIKVNRDVSDDQHKSEKALDGYTDWDYVIDNNGTIEGLIDQVETMLNKFKVI
jgi:dephospho-CoA kinase